MSVVLIALGLLVVMTGVILWAGGGKTVFEPQGVGIVEAIPEGLPESSAVPSEVLALFSYNLAYGLGGVGRQSARQETSALYDRLDRVIEAIAACEADAALLQAVDFASRRTSCIQQLHYVAAALGWGYVAAVTTWECRYLPAPWRQAGRVRAGQGVISRLPLEHNSWQRLPQSRAFPLPVSLFAPHDAVQVVDMRCGVRGVRLIQAHLTPGRADRYKRQAERLAAIVRRAAMPGCVVAGIDAPTAESVCSNPEATSALRPETGGVLLGSIWSDAEVCVLPPLAGVSEHDPVLVKLRL
jgi:endonuclease/exonuclease/phosphatase family metal-dependent hydrolase